MEHTKPWYASKSIWVNLLTAALGVAVASGKLSNDAANQVANWADQILGGAITVLGGFGIWARTAATAAISSKPPVTSIVKHKDFP